MLCDESASRARGSSCRCLSVFLFAHAFCCRDQPRDPTSSRPRCSALDLDAQPSTLFEPVPPHTLDPTPYTLDTTPYTLHPTP
eukprot:25855-Rhodomonas_salina.1